MSLFFPPNAVGSKNFDFFEIDQNNVERTQYVADLFNKKKSYKFMTLNRTVTRISFGAVTVYKPFRSDTIFCDSSAKTVCVMLFKFELWWWFDLKSLRDALTILQSVYTFS